MTTPLFPRQSANCILTCPNPIPCTCAANEDCIQINRDCQTCSQNTCVPQQRTSASSAGLGAGALAGCIIGALAFLTIVVLLVFRYRKRSLIRKGLVANGREVKRDIPASAETVLNRPDPTEKPPSVLAAPRPYSTDLDPQAQSSSLPSTGYNPQQPRLNPFDDTNSIQTAGTEGTNVIPIGLVPTQSYRASLQNSESQSLPSTNSSFPMRPPRSPELNLNLDHVNVSHDNVRTNGSKSVRSGISGISSRHSYMSNASYSSDLLSEAPMIMTPMKGSIRQVVGVVKAEVINADSLNPGSSSSDGSKPPAYVPKVTTKSPLATTSFGPDDIVSEVDESQDTTDPFGDESFSNHAMTTPVQTHHESTDLDLRPDNLNLPSSIPNDDSRPSSMATQAGSINSASRVAISPKPTSTGFPRRTTMVTPTTNASTLQEQQQRALAHAHAQAQAQGLDTRRISGSSVLSAASRADSILESFPFVPPSPISDRPIRTPPVSPLAQQSFVNPLSPLHQHTPIVVPPSPLSHQSFGAEPDTPAPPLPTMEDSQDLPAPPDRRTLGLSTGSQLSTASSGLGSFPFQIEPESDNSPRPSVFNGRQRASLDTLALTTALSSYPLGFDRGGVYPPTKTKK